jgi:hypothetical protein
MLSQMLTQSVQLSMCSVMMFQTTPQPSEQILLTIPKIQPPMFLPAFPALLTARLSCSDCLNRIRTDPVQAPRQQLMLLHTLFVSS